MISGSVTDLLDAIVSKTERGDDLLSIQIQVVIDTGFSGDLTLTSAAIESLGLAWLCRQEGMLADGELHILDVYEGEVVFGNEERVVEIELAELEPLIGMQLLINKRLTIDVQPGGVVTIDSLS